MNILKAILIISQRLLHFWVSHFTWGHIFLFVFDDAVQSFQLFGQKVVFVDLLAVQFLEFSQLGILCLNLADYELELLAFLQLIVVFLFEDLFIAL